MQKICYFRGAVRFGYDLVKIEERVKKDHRRPSRTIKSHKVSDILKGSVV